ncbi:energy transducer TonB [Silvimonas amylolytica]|uniref:TonB family protein n=1 Tax=Silvimonas amylolytica TaxID=449663 RepID=A0ABQ2PQ11_9NEIS|nr:energy transducer TonB [Silvimonas amylolytica]GGP27694.1 TonB family protein [Silvimonas amylolytica]
MPQPVAAAQPRESMSESPVKNRQLADKPAVISTRSLVTPDRKTAPVHSSVAASVKASGPTTTPQTDKYVDVERAGSTGVSQSDIPPLAVGTTQTRASDTNEPIRIISAPKPPLPDAARRRGEAGTVVLRIRVNELGAADVTIEQSSGSPRLDASARNTVQQSWRFSPAVHDGRRAAAEIIQPVEFRLTD